MKDGSEPAEGSAWARTGAGVRTLIVTAAAAGSRILGFVRDVMLASLLGSGPVADAFVAAFRIPSLFRRVLGEGALNAGVVPVLSRLAREGAPGAEGRAAGDVLAFAAAALLVVVAVAELAAPGSCSRSPRASRATRAGSISPRSTPG